MARNFSNYVLYLYILVSTSIVKFADKYGFIKGALVKLEKQKFFLNLVPTIFLYHTFLKFYKNNVSSYTHF